MSTDAVPPLFRRLVDDAALFPPGNAPMPVALTEHHHHLGAPYAALVGPFLVPAARWPEFTASAAGRLEVGLIGAGDVGQLVGAARQAIADERVGLAQLETPLVRSGEVVTSAVTTARRIREELGEADFDLFLEIPRVDGWLDAVAALAELPRPYRAWSKLRTGGPTADAFPTEAELAAFVETCLRRDHPFKLTAGLHRAIRHTDPRTAFEHHGYLNVLAAGCLGWWPAGGAPGGLTTVTEAIAARDPAPLVAVARETPPRSGESSESRTWFRSYGSCSVAEPLGDLAALGLLDPGLTDHLPAAREHHEERA